MSQTHRITTTDARLTDSSDSFQLGVPQADKPIVWVDAGIHAREWIAPATALYLIDKVMFCTILNPF